jgi:hypothetical protein
MTSNSDPVRRQRPPDRRAPIKVAQRTCPLGRGCVCCPAYTSKFRGQANEKCQLDHPAADRLCIPPIAERISACRERAFWSQDPLPAVPGWRPPHRECCVECGRITARRWTRPEDGFVMPWCAGEQVEPPGTVTTADLLPEPTPIGEAPSKRRARYNPGLRRHSWTKTSEHWKGCDWCGLRVNNRADPHSPRWFQAWDWPAHPERGEGSNDRGGRVPDCTGPEE